MLEITLKSDLTKLHAALKARPLQIVNAIENRLNVILHQLAAYVAREKLSGQILRRRTGILAGSVRVSEPAHVVGATIQGTIRAAEGLVFWKKAAAHIKFSR